MIFNMVGGGGTGLSKCTIIAKAETGATLGVYSDAATSVLVKGFKEIGSSGWFYATGLGIGTYYVKGESEDFNIAISNAITFSNFSVEMVILNILVPEEYQAVEYIQASGSQYIKSNYYLPSQNTDIIIEVDAAYTALISSGIKNVMCGVCDSSENFYAYVGEYNSKLTLQYGSSGVDFGTPDLNRHMHIINASTAKAYVDNTEKNLPTPSPNTGAQQFYIFAGCKSNGLADYLAKMRLYRLRVTNGTGNALADFRPCYRRNDGAVGLWDNCGKRFLTDFNGGNFAKGSDI